jgi:hypothetical protein
MVGNVWEHSIMADYNPLPAPQFSYTKQLEAYDELLRKRKSEQKWGTIFNNIDALTNPNHVTSGYFARNEKRIAGSYGTSLAQESKRLSLLGKAEKEGIHQEISKRLQDAMKKYSMSSKSEFDAWFETLGPHFAGEYKKYFDEWNAGVKVERAEIEDIRKEARFGWDRLKQDQDQAALAAKKVKEADVAFKDAEIDKLFLDNLNAYSNYNNQLQMGMASGGDNITKLRIDIFNQVQAQDWKNDVKYAVVYGAWDRLNKAITGSAVVPTASTALKVDAALATQLDKVTARSQKAYNKAAETQFNRLAKTEPANLEDYVAKRNRIIEVLNGSDASFEFKNALIAKYSDQYKGYESQRSKRYDPEKVPTYRVAVDAEGNVVFATNKQIQSGGLSPVESTRGSTARARPSQAFIQIAVEMSNTEKDQDKFMSVVNKIYDLGLLGITDPEDAKIVQKIIKEINDRAKKNDAAALAALREILGVNLPPGGGEVGIPSAPQSAIDFLLRENTEEARREFKELFGYIPEEALR